MGRQRHSSAPVTSPLCCGRGSPHTSLDIGLLMRGLINTHFMCGNCAPTITSPCAVCQILIAIGGPSSVSDRNLCA